jgi:hypothetical protein
MAYISIGGLTEGGFVPDHPPYDLPPNVFDEVEDISFDVNGIVPVVAEQELFPTMQANPLSLTRVKLGAGIEGWVYGDETDLYIIVDGLHTKITRTVGDGGSYSANDEARWDSTILHGIPIFSNGSDIPQQLDPNNPTAQVTNLANWPTDIRSRTLRAYKVFLIALGVKTGGGAYDQQVILWSSPADPGSVPPSWDYTDPAQQAGLFTFSETDDRIVDGLQLGDEFIIYKERSIYAMRYIGGTFVMSIKRRPGDIGLLTKGALVEVPQGHFFISDNDVYIYNGTSSPQSVSTGRVRRELFERITKGQKKKVFCKHNSTEKNVWVFYPSDGEVWCNKALVWNYETNTWSLRNVPNVSGADFGTIKSQSNLTWDSLNLSWGGRYSTTWRNENASWLSIQATWVSTPDSGSWESDPSTWEETKDWDAQTSKDIWDGEEYEPVTENLVMATRLEGESVYDSLTNMSSADGVSWTGGDKYPPLWLVAGDGKRKPGRLVKRALAIVGRDHRGQLEVNRVVQKILTEFYPEVEEGVIRIRFGCHDTPKSEVEWQDWITFDSLTDQKVDTFISGRYLAFEIQGAGDGEGYWLLSGYGMEINKGGRY